MLKSSYLHTVAKRDLDFNRSDKVVAETLEFFSYLFQYLHPSEMLEIIFPRSSDRLICFASYVKVYVLKKALKNTCFWSNHATSSPEKIAIEKKKFRKNFFQRLLTSSSEYSMLAWRDSIIF